MDNVGYDWERGFAAGVESQAPLLAKAQARIAELERADFVPRSDLTKAEACVTRLEKWRVIQADCIRRLVVRLGGC